MYLGLADNDRSSPGVVRRRVGAALLARGRERRRHGHRRLGARSQRVGSPEQAGDLRQRAQGGLRHGAHRGADPAGERSVSTARHARAARLDPARSAPPRKRRSPRAREHSSPASRRCSRSAASARRAASRFTSERRTFMALAHAEHRHPRARSRSIPRTREKRTSRSLASQARSRASRKSRPRVTASRLRQARRPAPGADHAAQRAADLDESTGWSRRHRRVSLSRADIVAPLMVVRGDGALVSASFARTRPIETILSRARPPAWSGRAT